MKKIFFSLVALAALAACSKSEVEYETIGEIGFYPVAKLNTKAVVADTEYPQELDMYVFANSGLAGAAVSTYTDHYFRNALFEHKQNGIFGGTPAYYWPNVKKLIFSGYSNSGNAAACNPDFEYFVGDAVNPAEWIIKIDGYNPGEGSSVEGNNDLMWFPVTAAIGKADKSAGQELSDGNVDVIMKHACSWITFNVKGNAITGKADDASTTDVNEATTWKILELKILDIAKTGNVKLGANAVWTPSSTTEPLPVFSGSKALTEAYVDYTNLSYNDLVVIPQDTKQLYIRYQYVSQKGAAADGSQDIICTEEITKPLTYTGDTGWQPGVHYIYNILIGTDEILIEPTVAEWEPKNNESDPDDNGQNSDIEL